MNVAQDFLDATINSYQANKRMAEKAVAQIDDKALRRPLDDHTNSIAVIMKHVSGNLKSRWTDFLTTDGEKEWRHRDNEFVDTFETRDALLEYWEQGWSVLLRALESLEPEDCSKTVFIRGVEHSVSLAMQRSLAHTAYHIGQIVQLARHFAGNEWQTLTIPRGESEQFNERHWGEGGKSHS